MKKTATKSFRPGMEALEDRMVMTATLLQDVVRIESTPFNDTVKVTIERTPIVAQRSGLVVLPSLPSFPSPFGQVVVRENGVVTGRFAAAGVRLIEFYGFAGKDSFTNKTAIRSYAEGGAGKDTLIGGSVTDEFFGGDQNDILMGKGGLDYLDGEAGNDRVDGGIDGFADEIRGGLGADTFVPEYIGITIFDLQNRDAPQDFNMWEGDIIEGSWAPPVLASR